MMGYADAAETIQNWLDVYSAPKDMEEALEIAILALRRCDVLDEMKKNKEKRRNYE